MKKLTSMIISMIVITLFCSASMADNLKIGLLDFQRVITESKVAKKMNDKLQTKYKPRQDEIMSIQSKLKDKVTKSEEKSTKLERNESVMKSNQVKKLRAEIKDLENEIKTLQGELEKKGESFQTDLQNDQVSASKKFSDQVDKEVKRISKKENFDFVLQKQVTVFIKKKNHDITDKVISAIDKNA
jgi:outer membrane protein